MTADRNTGAAVVLAAGRGSRMGMPKAILRLYDGCTMLEWALRSLGAAVPIGHVVAVCSDEDVAAHAGASGCAVAWQAAPERGMMSSARIGLAAASTALAVRQRSLSWVLLHPVDVPLESGDAVFRFVEQWHASRADAAIACHENQLGHPLLLGKAGIECVARADEERHSLRDCWAELAVVYVEWGSADPLTNLNTPADLEHWQVRQVSRVRASQ